MAELADALDLGSSVPDVKVQVLSPAPKIQVQKLGFFYRIGNCVIVAKRKKEWYNRGGAERRRKEKKVPPKASFFEVI